MKRTWKRLVSTRRWVERSEARLHRFAASLTLAVRDMPEHDIRDTEQRAIRQAIHVAEVQLQIALDICRHIELRRRRDLLGGAKIALPAPLVAWPVPGDPTRMHVPGIWKLFEESNELEPPDFPRKGR